MTANDAPPPPVNGASGSYGLGDLFSKVVRLGRKPVFWVTVVAGVLAVLLVVTFLDLRSARRQLGGNATDRAASCSSAKRQALAAVQLATESASASPVATSNGANWSAAQLIHIVMVACQANPRDDKAEKLANRLLFLVKGLMGARKFEVLGQLLATLDRTPMEDWKNVELPAEPSEEAQMSGDDAARAAAGTEP